MRDHDALLRAVLIDPVCDTARGALADSYDDAGQPDRAEFIRLQVEATKTRPQPESCTACFNDRYGGLIAPPADPACRWHGLRQRERVLWAYLPQRNGAMWDIKESLPTPHEWAALLGGQDDGSQLTHAYPWAFVRRGLVDEVRLTLAAFAGGPCGRCQGQGRYMGTAGGDFGETGPVWCGNCSGTGRTEGVARSLFERHPVTAVRLTCREPHELWDGMRPAGADFGWFPAEEVDVASASLPVEIHKLLLAHPLAVVYGHWIAFPTVEAAYAALSAAAVAWGRGLVGLPPLPSAIPGPP